MDETAKRKDEKAVRHFTKTVAIQDKLEQRLKQRNLINRSPLLNYLVEVKNNKLSPRKNKFDFRFGVESLDLTHISCA